MKNEKFMTDDMIKVKRYFEGKVEEDFLLALNQYEKAKTSLSIALPHTNEKGFKVNQIAKKEIKIIKNYWYDRMER